MFVITIKMLLKSIKLINYRNHVKYDIDFDNITVLVGKNGVGKSNIIEAIYLMGFAKSFRTNNDEVLINYDTAYAQILAETNIGHYNFVLQKQDGKVKKQIAIDKIKSNLVNLVGGLKMVLFDPKSLDIIIGPPGNRRKYMDMLISQIDKKYLKVLIKYKKILRAKNELLKKISHREALVKELHFWNKEFIKNAKIIMHKRMDFVNYLSDNISDYYKEIALDKNIKFDVKYNFSCKNIDDFENVVEKIKNKEIMYEKTLIGPHLDDIKILIDDKNAYDVCSRGEIRTIALALKIAEIKYLKAKSDSNKILLLLDDIFSELDIFRRDQIIKIIKDYQAVISTTDENFIKKNMGKIKIIKL